MAQRELNWTSRALKDRAKILEYWYKRTGYLDYPVKLERTFSATLSLLKHQPHVGTFFDEKRNIRFVVIRYFKIYYTFTDEILTVLTIWDTRRNPNNLNV